MDFNTARVHNYIRSTEVMEQACNVLKILYHRQVSSSRNLSLKPVANNIRKAANKCSVCRSNSPTTGCPLASLPVKTAERNTYSRPGFSPATADTACCCNTPNHLSQLHSVSWCLAATRQVSLAPERHASRMIFTPSVSNRTSCLTNINKAHRPA